MADGGAALASVERSVPDVLVLDVAMPGVDGLAVTRRLRAKGLAVPILLLTARDALAERVAGLDAGADDYLVKPFETRGADARGCARCCAATARPRSASPSPTCRSSPTRARRAAASATSSSRAARPSCSSCSCAMRARVVTRETALEQVWGGEGEASLNVVDRYVAYLRRKLGDPPIIHTVRGLGFRLGRA